MSMHVLQVANDVVNFFLGETMLLITVWKCCLPSLCFILLIRT